MVLFVRSFWSYFYLFLVPFLLTACSISQTPTPETAVPSPTPFPADILAACNPDEQVFAMRSDQIPDWDALPIQACYDMTLKLNEDLTYDGEARVTFTNQTNAPLNDVLFRTYPNAAPLYGSRLDISQAKINGQIVEGESTLSDGTGFRMQFASPLLPGETVVIELTFMAYITLDYNDSETVYGIFNFDSEFETWTLANWYPSLAPWRDGRWQAQEVMGIGDAVVSETALYRVTLNLPEGYLAATTGVQLGTDASPPTFVSGPVRDFTIVAGQNLIAIDTEIDGTRVVHWGLPDGKAAWSEVLEVAAASLELFNEKFGPYPYAELDLVSVPLQIASGVEYPGLILNRESLYTDANERQFFLPVVVAHEVAHQWWYGVVGNDVLADPWQDEALTSYSSYLYFEAFDRPFYHGLLANMEERMQSAPDEDLITQSVASFDEDGSRYSAVVYTKGSFFFRAIREEVGDDAFFKALQNYYAEHQYLIATPASLLASFETACGCELEDLYKDWGVQVP